MAQARSARAINRVGEKKRVCLKGSATISIHEERLQISEAGRNQTNQFKIVFKSLARFGAQFRVKR